MPNIALWCSYSIVPSRGGAVGPLSSLNQKPLLPAANVKDDVFVVRIAEKVKIEIARGAVAKVLDKGDKVEVDEA